jgi:hypothetical protein
MMSERVVPPPKALRGSVSTDDHVASSVSQGGHQPTAELDPTTDEEHLASRSQGVRPEQTPDADEARERTEAEPGT